MSSKNRFGNEVSVDEQAFEKHEEVEYDEDGFEVVDETPEFRATVDMEVQAKVDSNHPDARVQDGPDHMVGKTLEEEEKIKAREAELEHISTQSILGEQVGREARTRTVAATHSAERRETFQKRRASVNPLAHPDEPDPREKLERTQLAAVNKQSMRMVEKLDGWSRAAVSRRLAEAVVTGMDMMSAVVSVFEELQTAPGQMLPLGKIEDVDQYEVCIQGTVTQLWEPSNSAIQQVGLIEDETGRTKFTVWKKSNQPLVDEGERVQIHGAARNWYEGRVSVALTGWSIVHFPERGRWWEA